MSNNNVRGPTSALTEYLKASGIAVVTTAARRRAANAAEQQQTEAGPSGTRAGDDEDVEMQDAEEAPTPARRTRSGRRSAATAYDSEELDDPPEESSSPVKKRKLNKAAEAKQKAKEKAKAKAKKNKKDEDSEDDAEVDPYRALSKMWGGGGKASPAKPTVGNFEDCAKCEQQFTVTKYTMAAIPGPGFLCHRCAKESGNDPFKKPAAPKRKKVPADKRTVVNFEEKRFPTLVSLCIELITKHIDDVEALGDIGAINMDAISKALSKNRGLTPQNAPLFYSAANTTLTLYDATNLPSPALETLFHLNPNLTTLRLDFCGHIDDAAMKTLSNSLPDLECIELLGPFLVRPAGWQQFFAAHPSLRSFKITQSPRFDLECMHALKQHCARTLTSLRLREVGLLDDEFLAAIQGLSKLEELDIADSGDTDACSESGLTAVLGALAKNLRVLDLSRHASLSGSVLSKGLERARKMEALVLMNASGLTDEDVASFFDNWKNGPLCRIEMSRNHELGSAALIALLKHSGRRLEVLAINGWGGVEEEALKVVGQLGCELKKLDVGWIRDVDDFVVKSWMEGEEEEEAIVVKAPSSKGKATVRGRGCPNLGEVKLWGCNKITPQCPRKKGVSIYGVESHTAM